jgi:hypothetical protein
MAAKSSKSTFWRFGRLRELSGVTAGAAAAKAAGSGLLWSWPRVLRFRVDAEVEAVAAAAPVVSAGGLEPALNRAAAERVTLGDMRMGTGVCFPGYGFWG